MMHDERPDDMQELVTEIARALVDEPEAVNVEAVKRAENTVLRLRVAPSDVGKVIGKQGRTARSMRHSWSGEHEISPSLHIGYSGRG
jgi:uncharacterized protein